MKVITIYNKDKPVDVEKTANLLKFEITVNKHRDYYDFENSEEVVDDFLKNVYSRFKPFCLKLTKCLFLIKNIQQPAFKNLRLILNTRYWTTHAYKATYFKFFLFLSGRILTQKLFSKSVRSSQLPLCKCMTKRIKLTIS